jgi:DNA repair protein RecO (recombination protein O)
MLLTATVLRVRPHREHDRLYTLYTKEHGKLTVLGVGTAKVTSKLAGHLGPLMVSELSIVPARGWDKLTGAELLERFGVIPGSLPRLGVAAYLLELTDALTKENHPDLKLWELLIHCLRSLERAEVPEQVRSRFEERILPILGERPPLAAHLSVELKSARWLSWARGGKVAPVS